METIPLSSPSRISMASLSTLAQDYLEYLTEILEDQLPSTTDVDLTFLTLTLSFPGVGQYLLNYHGTTQQLWLSSPVTGAHQFKLDSESWVCCRTGTPLAVLLATELETITKTPLRILKHA